LAARSESSKITERSPQTVTSRFSVPQEVPVGTTETAEERQRLACLEDRYRNELTGEEERLQLRNRIRRLKRKLETAEETVDAIHSGLERMES
jgi:predicted RNase H-like nuclease (RuvC/YqgF family)